MEKKLQYFPVQERLSGFPLSNCRFSIYWLVVTLLIWFRFAMVWLGNLSKCILVVFNSRPGAWVHFCKWAKGKLWH